MSAPPTRHAVDPSADSSTGPSADSSTGLAAGPAGRSAEEPDFDLGDEELRATGWLKWAHPGPDVLPAWVAELDVRPCPAVLDALHEAVDRSGYGYPPPDRLTGLCEATAAFLDRRFGWTVDPARVVLTGDVMAGMRLVVETLCEQAPVVVPVPTYPPFLDLPALTGRPIITVPLAGDGHGRDVLDLAAVDAALAAGARTVLLAAPHNPTGRVFDAAELAALRDVVCRHRARVISDEIHAPLVLPGARHVPYASLDGTEGQVTTLVAASKAWNLAGLKCAQIVAGSAEDLRRLRAVPPMVNHGTSPLGIVAALAAYTAGDPWLDGLLVHLDRMRSLLSRLLAERLPAVHWQPPEGTYLAWLDVRGTGVEHPAELAMARGRVMISRGRDFGADDGFVRVNLGTSAERLERIVERLAEAWTG
ncbi:MAG: aminotransferase class I/II-fold pyridoxal phosphate-dependent enzyme [Actinomycetales bacterium]|nr:aminotransferase class I/II-fold pyridoxal phosphate-dependent enzyme [Actinomycetales bacterium]